MKTLTKEKLNELAKVMPMLSEKEQSAYIGGSRYYTASGVYLGEVSDGSNSVKITSLSSIYGDYTTLAANSILSENADAATRQNVLETMGAAVGIPRGHLQVVAGDSGTTYGAQSYMPTQRNQDGSVTMGNNYSVTVNLNDGTFNNSSGNNSSGADYYDQMNALAHEAYHLNDYNAVQTANETESMKDNYQLEVDAYTNMQTFGDYYDNGTPEMRDFIVRKISQYSKMVAQTQ